jgi:putative heme-binding domain-containing protein
MMIGIQSMNWRSAVKFMSSLFSLSVRWIQIVALWVLLLVGAAGQVDGAEPSSADSQAVNVPKIYWDKNPRIVSYQLRRLSNKQLVRVPLADDDLKYKPGYEAIISRTGLHQKLRARALVALAKMNKTSMVAEMIAALTRLDKASDLPGMVLHDLMHLMGLQQAEALAAGRQGFGGLASGAENPIVRQVGYLGLLLSGQSVDDVWQVAIKNEGVTGGGSGGASGGGRADLINALPMFKNPAKRQAMYRHIKPLVVAGKSDGLRSAAIESISYVPGVEAEAFNLLAQLILDQKNKPFRTVAVRSMGRIDVKFWSAENVLPLAKSLVELVKATPTAKRTEPSVIDAIQLGQDLAAKLPADQAGAIRKALRSLGVQVVLIRTVPHEMLFDRRYFAVEAGKAVQIVFANNDIMPHNVVVVARGAMEEVGMAAELMQPTTDPKTKQFVPDSPKVLAAGMLLQADERGAINFIAPTEPGEYPYVCTFPGHWRRMYGVMVVVKDLDAYLANPKVPQDPITGKPMEFPGGPWMMKDLAQSLGELDHGRSFAQGKAIFEQLGCAQCHKIAGKGGAIGPDLNEVFKRWKGKRIDVLRELLEPSKVIDPKFAAYLVSTLDGENLFGVITKQDKDSITLVTNPNNPKPRKIARDDIIDQAKAPASLMPKGLLDRKRHSKSQVLDLLGYLEAGGKADHEIYKR